LQYIAHGRGSKEIGEALCISEHTVKWRLRCMLSKLDATGRTEGIDIARKPGLLQWD
jgi:DNA-binding NarL/FixJ family response regulator